MNEEQVKSGLRTFLATFGGLIAGWFAAKGWFTINQVESVLNSPTFISLAGSVIVGIWGIVTHTQKNAVAVVATIAEDPASPVKGIITTNTLAGRDLAKDIPSDLVVPAGTADAAAMARPSTGASA
jgi:hypothetical protein